MMQQIKNAAKYMNLDMIKVVLHVTWIWAWVGLQVTKCFELIFKLILCMPDSWLLVSRSIQNTAGKEVKLLAAVNQDGEKITNKLKFFLQWYWEKGGEDKAYDSNGFDFREFNKLTGVSVLYCSYLLIEQAEKTDICKPELFWQNVKTIFVEQENKKYYKYTVDKKKLKRKKIFLGHVDFDDENAKIADINIETDIANDNTDNESNNATDVITETDPLYKEILSKIEKKLPINDVRGSKAS